LEEKISSQTVGTEFRSNSQDFLNKEEKRKKTTQARPIKLHLLYFLYSLVVSMCPKLLLRKIILLFSSHVVDEMNFNRLINFFFGGLLVVYEVIFGTR
jgi:hypothetical protein